MPAAVKTGTFFINGIIVQQCKYRQVYVCVCLCVFPMLPVSLITNHSPFFLFRRQEVKANQPTPICAAFSVPDLIERLNKLKAERRKVLAAGGARAFALFPALTLSASFLRGQKRDLKCWTMTT